MPKIRLHLTDQFSERKFPLKIRLENPHPRAEAFADVGTAVGGHVDVVHLDLQEFVVSPPQGADGVAPGRFGHVVGDFFGIQLSRHLIHDRVKGPLHS